MTKEIYRELVETAERAARENPHRNEWDTFHIAMVTVLTALMVRNDEYVYGWTQDVMDRIRLIKRKAAGE